MNITKILIPLDLTEHSKNTLNAAIQIANQNNASIHLINFCISLSSDGTIPIDTDELLRTRRLQMREFIQQNCKINSDRLVTEHGSVEFHHDVITGMAGDEIPAYVKKHHVDLVIMGRREEHDPIDRFLGSVSSAVLEATECPVLLIPQNYNFENIHKICFTVGSQSHFKLYVDYVTYWADLFQSNIHFVHVDQQNKEDTEIFQEIKQDLEKQNKVVNDYAFAILHGDSIPDVINAYAENQNIDLIMTIHKRRSFLESLFNRSLSIKFSHLVKTPLLVIN